MRPGANSEHAGIEDLLERPSARYVREPNCNVTGGSINNTQTIHLGAWLPLDGDGGDGDGDGDGDSRVEKSMGHPSTRIPSIPSIPSILSTSRMSTSSTSLLPAPRLHYLIPIVPYLPASFYLSAPLPPVLPAANIPCNAPHLLATCPLSPTSMFVSSFLEEDPPFGELPPAAPRNGNGNDDSGLVFDVEFNSSDPMMLS